MQKINSMKKMNIETPSMNRQDIDDGDSSPLIKRARTESESKLKIPRGELRYPNSRSNLQKVLLFSSVFTLLLLLMLWDMKQMQKMSIIIHDDHTSHWVDMDYSMLPQWYSPLDICMLKEDKPSIDIMEYRHDNCSKYAGVTSYVTNRLYCNIGSSIGSKPCYGPLNTRTFFNKTLKGKVFGDPHNNKLRTSMRMLASLKKPVVFIGDGLSRQNQDALICEMMRTDKVSVSGHYSDTSANYTIKWRKSDLALNVIYFKMTTIHESIPFAKKLKFRILTEQDNEQKLQYDSIPQHEKQAFHPSGNLDPSLITSQSYQIPLLKQSNQRKNRPVVSEFKNDNKNKSKNRLRRPDTRSIEERNNEKATQNSKITTVKSNPNNKNTSQGKPYVSNQNNTKTITDNSVKFNTTNTNNDNKNTTVPSIPIDNQLKNKTISPNHGMITFEKIKRYIGRIVDEHNGVVLIGNVGVYYNSREQFRTEVPELLSWMDSLSKEANCTVFYRETAAQHWNHTESGYYDRDYDERPYNNGSCVPVADSTPEMDWRNTDVKHLIENDGYDNIRIIKFKDVTQPLYNMHPSGQEEQDCTNFCYFPQMWQTIWHDIYKGTVNSTSDPVMLKDYG